VPFTSLWSPWGKVRALAEPFIAASPPGLDESVAAFVRRRLGSEFLDGAVEPFVAGIFAGDPEQLSMASSFPQLAAFERAYGSVVGGLIRTRFARGRSRGRIRMFSFRHGVGQLPEALRHGLGDRVRTGVRVAGVQRQHRDGVARFVVQADVQGEACVLTADHLVMATPADVAARLLAPLSPTLADHLEQIPYAPVGLVHLGVARSSLTRFPNGSGCLIPKRERLPLLGSLWSSNVYPERAPEGRVLLTNYIGGVRDSDALKWSDVELVDLVVGVLRDLVGLGGRPEFVRVLRHPRAIPQYLLGHGARVATIERLLQPLSGLHLTGNYLHGVSVRDCLTQGVRLAGAITERVQSVPSAEEAVLASRSLVEPSSSLMS
jgi:oxygen-dependent protoporphyrinogen oxidase